MNSFSFKACRFPALLPAVCFILILTSLAVGCGNQVPAETPEETLGNFLQSYMDGEFRKAEEYCGADLGFEYPFPEEFDLEVGNYTDFELKEAVEKPGEMIIPPDVAPTPELVKKMDEYEKRTEKMSLAEMEEYDREFEKEMGKMLVKVPAVSIEVEFTTDEKDNTHKFEVMQYKNRWLVSGFDS